MDQLPVGLAQAEQPGEAVDDGEGSRHEQRSRDVGSPGAEAQIGDGETFMGDEFDGEERGQGGNPHDACDDQLAVEGRGALHAEAGHDQSAFDDPGDDEGDEKVGKQSFAV